MYQAPAGRQHIFLSHPAGAQYFFYHSHGCYPWLKLFRHAARAFVIKSTTLPQKTVGGFIAYFPLLAVVCGLLEQKGYTRPCTILVFVMVRSIRQPASSSSSQNKLLRLRFAEQATKVFVIEDIHNSLGNLLMAGGFLSY